MSLFDGDCLGRVRCVAGTVDVGGDVEAESCRRAFVDFNLDIHLGSDFVGRKWYGEVQVEALLLYRPIVCVAPGVLVSRNNQHHILWQGDLEHHIDGCR